MNVYATGNAGNAAPRGIGNPANEAKMESIVAVLSDLEKQEEELAARVSDLANGLYRPLGLSSLAGENAKSQVAPCNCLYERLAALRQRLQDTLTKLQYAQSSLGA